MSIFKDPSCKVQPYCEEVEDNINVEMREVEDSVKAKGVEEEDIQPDGSSTGTPSSVMLLRLEQRY